MSRYYIQHVVLQTNYKNRFSIFKYIFTVLTMYIMVTVTEGGRNFIHHGDEVHFVFAWCVCECVSKGMSEDFFLISSQTFLFFTLANRYLKKNV